MLQFPSNFNPNKKYPLLVTVYAGPSTNGARETFTLPREAARTKARDFFRRYPKEAYMSSVERWRELPDGAIEFTMRRLSSAD